MARLTDFHRQQRPARAHGPIVRGDYSNIGSRARSVPIPSPPVSSLGFPLPLYIPVIWGRFPASPSPPRIPAANSDRTRTEVSSRHHHGVACYVTEHMHGDFFLFVCFDRSASTGGGGGNREVGFQDPVGGGDPRGGRFQAPCSGGRTASWGGFRISVVAGGEPRGGAASGSLRRRRTTGGGRRRRIRTATNRRRLVQFSRHALIAFLQAFSTQTTNRSACMHFDGGMGGIFFV
jgi:hypothetical protein